MPYDAILHIIYYTVSIIVSILVSFLFWERRSSMGARAMSIMMLFAAEWSFADLLSDLSSSIIYKIFWNKVSFLGVVIIPVFFLHFTLQYTNHEKIITFKNKILLSIIPFITLLLISSNKYHHLFMYDDITEMVDFLTVLSPNYRGWFWVHAIYSYSLILISTFLLIKKLLYLPQIYRKQSIIMIMATLIPLLVSIIYTAGFIPFGSVDPTSMSFTFSGILFFFGMFRYKLFDLIPKARASVIESMKELVIVLDTNNRIIDINTSARKLFDKNTDELIGVNIFELLGDSTTQVLDAIELLKSNEKVNISVGNPKRYYELRITPLYDESSRVSARFAIMHDITDLKEAMEKMENSRRAAEEANKAKSQFLATMSHEIRTPLNGIIGMTEMLSTARLSGEYKQFLDSIIYSADSLRYIINDILDFSKIEAGKMDLDNTAFDVKELVETVVKTFSYKAVEKGLDLTCHISEEVPGSLIGDPVKIRQILVNLIGNSLKFTSSGSIKVQVRKIKGTSTNAVIRFSVTDTGIGIPKEKINNLFISFQQLDGSTTRKYGGTGLGLAIVKRLVLLMGGSIEVESEPGKGSLFYFDITFQVSEPCVNKQIPVKPAYDRSLENIRVLLVEDNSVNQMYMRKLLEKSGTNVDIAGNGKIALKKCIKNTYDMILMDLQMPEMDGYEATIAIKKLDYYSQNHIPIIALTANVTEDDRSRCIQSGMDDFLTKPVNSSNLLGCIKKHVPVKTGAS